MITKITNGILITENEILKNQNIYIEDGKIKEISENTLPFDYEIDAQNNYVSAGFIDLHTHGAVGCDFAEGTEEEIINAVNYHCKHGTTTIFPTTLSSSIDELEKGIGNIKKATQSGEILPNIAGVHLEGPYFSKNQCGAQNPDFITPPIKNDYEALLKNYKGIIKRWSFAPELEGSLEFTETLTEYGVTPSIAHSNAKYNDIIPVYEKGCKLITHFYSCISTITREKGYRKLGITEFGYLYDDVIVEAIADGHHIPPELFKMLYKIKGSDNICLVTDSMSCCGIDSEFATLGGVPCRIKNGVACLLDESAFAGSIATTNFLLRFCIKDVGIDICNAVKMLTINPAKVMGLTTKGRLEIGFDADLVIFDDDINIKNVLVNGILIK